MILIVEDDRMLMMGLQVALKTKGSQVLQAGSVREALSVYDQQAGSIDFVLLDMRLPDGTGMEVCRHIRRRSSVPIIFLTACDDEKNAVEALGSGGDDYMTKPFHLRELLARMDAIRRRSAPQREKKTIFREGRERRSCSRRSSTGCFWYSFRIADSCSDGTRSFLFCGMREENS